MIRFLRRFARVAIWSGALLISALPPGLDAFAAPTAAEEAADADVVEKAFAAASEAEFDALVPALRTALARAPSVYPRIERRGDTVIVRGNSGQEGLFLAGLIAGEKKPVQVNVEFNIYGLAAFVLGAAEVGRKRPIEALAFLDKGLALQPDNLMLVTEKGMALTLLQRHAEALVLFDAAIADNSPQYDDSGLARLLRARGFSLIELDRLDEAEAAYRSSLKLEPDHGGALAELKYIVARRSGGDSKGIGVYTTEEARKSRAGQ